MAAAAKITSALGYAAASVLIMIVNKIVLTTWRFPSPKFLALGQFVFTALCIAAVSSRPVAWVQVRRCDRNILNRMAPLAVLFSLNVITGLTGTHLLNLAMFGALRRVSILMTMMLEWYIVGAAAAPTRGTTFSVLLMLLGAFVAATNDLSFAWYGYMVVLLNNVCTAGSNVCVKRSLTGEFRLTKFELLFYQSLCAIPVATVALLSSSGFGGSGGSGGSGDSSDLMKVAEFPHWGKPAFLFCFLSSCGMGLVLNYTAARCTDNNSALTTTVVGCVKNVLVAYMAMAGLGGDYLFSWPSFVGLNISIAGSLFFSYEKYRGSDSGGGGGSCEGGRSGKEKVPRAKSYKRCSLLRILAVTALSVCAVLGVIGMPPRLAREGGWARDTSQGGVLAGLGGRRTTGLRTWRDDVYTQSLGAWQRAQLGYLDRASATTTRGGLLPPPWTNKPPARGVGRANAAPSSVEKPPSTPSRSTHSPPQESIIGNGGGDGSPQPYLSIVVCSRHDNYGDRVHTTKLQRTRNFMRSVAWLAEASETHVELVVVDWNRPTHGGALADVLAPWPKGRGFLSTRILEVPAAVHQAHRNWKELGLFEFVGRNLGTRVARGIYVLGSAVDDVFNGDMVRLLRSKAFIPRTLYRSPRTEMSLDLSHGDLRGGNMAARCDAAVAAAPASKKDTPLARPLNDETVSLEGRGKPLTPASFTGALTRSVSIGDFLLAHRDVWQDSRGVREASTVGVVDIEFLMTAAKFGKAKFAPIPSVLCHQEHGTSDWKAVESTGLGEPAPNNWHMWSWFKE